jgi:hypothetical protein
VSALLASGAALTRAWVRLYTRGLDPEAREARRAEIESDLWEHQAWARGTSEEPADTGLHLLARLVLGVPADLAWRRTCQRTGASLSAGVTKGLTKMGKRMVAGVAAGATLVVGLWLVLLTGAGNLGRWATGGERWMLLFGLQAFVAGALLLAGVVATRRSPRVGAGLVIAGAVLAAGSHYWMLPIGAPLALLLATGALMRAQAKRAVLRNV